MNYTYVKALLFLANDHLPRVLHLSDNNGDNDMRPGTVFWHFTYGLGKTRKTSAKRTFDEVSSLESLHQRGPLFPNDVRVSHGSSGRDGKKGWKENTNTKI